MIFFGKTLFKFVTSRTAATSIVRGHRTSKTEVLQFQRKSKPYAAIQSFYVGLEDIKRSKLSGNLWSFPYLIDVIARLVVVKRGFTCSSFL